MSNDIRKYLIFLVVMASLPFWVTKDVYTQGILIRALVYVALAQSWNIIGGLGGQLSLGHATFFGLGAYTSGLLLARLGLTPWAGIFVGILVAVVVSLIIGYTCFRLTGVYFALASFTISLVLEIIARHFDKITGGDVGLSLPLLGNSPANFQFSSPIPYYLIGLVMISIFFLITRWVMGSRFGYYLRAIKDDQDAAEAMGVDATRMKLAAYALSALMASIAGVFYIQCNLFIDPATAFGTHQNVQILLASVAGGIGTLWGPIIGGLFLVPIGELTNAYVGKGIVGVDVLAYSVVLIIIILFLPKGLINLPSLFRKKQKTRSQREEEKDLA